MDLKHPAFHWNHCGWGEFGTGLHLICSICLAEGKLKREPNSKGSLREARSHCIENYIATWRVLGSHSSGVL